MSETIEAIKTIAPFAAPLVTAIVTIDVPPKPEQLKRKFEKDLMLKYFSSTHLLKTGEKT